MIDLILGHLKLYWKAHRLQVAITIAILIFTTKLSYPYFKTNSYEFWDSLLSSVMTLVLYLFVTPVWLVIYYLYKKQLMEKTPGDKIEMSEIFNLDTYLFVFTIYASIAFSLSMFVNLEILVP